MGVMRTELYWIEGPWRGRLAIAPRPRGGDWLEDEISVWKGAGISKIVSALTDEEIAELELAHEKELSENAGIKFVAFPIVDRGVPASDRAMLELVRRLEKALAHGETVAIHCRQGVGRASLLAACILVVGGVDPVVAFERIAIARGRSVPDTSEQREWVLQFARHRLSALPEEAAAVEDVFNADEYIAAERMAKLTAKLRELGIGPESP